MLNKRWMEFGSVARLERSDGGIFDWTSESRDISAEFFPTSADFLTQSSPKRTASSPYQHFAYLGEALQRCYAIDHFPELVPIHFPSQSRVAFRVCLDFGGRIFRGWSRNNRYGRNRLFPADNCSTRLKNSMFATAPWWMLNDSLHGALRVVLWTLITTLPTRLISRT